MKNKILSLLLCFAFTANLHAQSGTDQEPSTELVAMSATPSPIPTKESKWTLNRILAGSAFALLVGSGVYYMLKPTQKKIVHRTLASSPVVANHRSDLRKLIFLILKMTKSLIPSTIVDLSCTYCYLESRLASQKPIFKV